ncbi:FAD/NAD(P)-binding domain-containing protein [Pholiota conissans]|uniref:FAD/NAD(P)-binding domain-containing protein n=1 Tax=Pholiota conissans TaxID=109636 RepID=A0A9P5ZAQ8_9AGAR|nr:FAD/NAD(P)-binding domain-containing protein [Pholiota conissans]
MGGTAANTNSTKTVVVLGAAYGGAHAAQILARDVPEGWKVILIDRNSHANHVYVMPRFAVLPGHEYKAFIPYTHVFREDSPKPEHIFLHAEVLSLRPNSLTLSRTFPELGIPTHTLAFDYAIYALGSHLPPPLNLWGSPAGQVEYYGLKSEGCEWFKEKQKQIKEAPTVLVVGGGALGIQFATDIKSIYPEKTVTLLHSRLRLLPRFDEKMHEEIRDACEKLDVKLILGERLDLDSVDDGKAKVNAAGQKIVRTVTGREIAADLLLLCTGQAPNTELLANMDPATVNENNKLVRVLKTLQIDTSRSSESVSEALENLSLDASKTKEVRVTYPHIFAIGDAADAFGAIPAGHNAYAQGEVAAKNVVTLIKNAVAGADAQEELEQYTPKGPAIKVSLGLTDTVYQVGGTIGKKTGGQPDLQAASMWPLFGIKVEKDEDMRV